MTTAKESQATDTVYFTLRAAPRPGHKAETLRVGVDPDGQVRLYSELAGYWTICHDLSPRTCARARAQAARVRAGLAPDEDEAGDEDRAV